MRDPVHRRRSGPQRHTPPLADRLAALRASTPPPARKRAYNTHTHTTTERGYGQQHQLERAKWAPIVKAGRAICWRCRRLILPGQPWDLGHDDNDRRIYRGPECRGCNRATAAHRAQQRRQRRTQPPPKALAFFNPRSTP
jgi:hypothetical protein